MKRKDATPEEAFTDQLAARISALPIVSNVRRVAPLCLLVTREGAASEVETSLSTLFAEVQRSDASDRARHIDNYLAAITDGFWTGTWAEASKLIMPALRNVSLGYEFVLRDERPRMPLRSVAPFMFQTFVIDRPKSMQYVDHSDIAGWGVSMGDAWFQAVGNLASKDLRGNPLNGITGTSQVNDPDGYASSWVLVPDIFDKFGEALGGPVVALVPHRDTACFVRSDNPAALSEALAWALDQFAQHPRGLSPVPYVVPDLIRMLEWRPSSDSPLRNQVQRAQHYLARRAYEEQRVVLEDLARRQGKDVFVASLLLQEYPDGSVISRTVWPKGVDKGLLPLADHVCIAGPDGKEIIEVTWDDAKSLGANWIQHDSQFNPPRLVITGWPAEEISRLREQDVRTR